MIERLAETQEVVRLLRANPVVALLGPRQVGKSTLARAVAKRWPTSKVTFLDLERCQSPPSWGHLSPGSWGQVEAVDYRAPDRIRAAVSRGPPEAQPEVSASGV